MVSFKFKPTSFSRYLFYPIGRRWSGPLKALQALFCILWFLGASLAVAQADAGYQLKEGDVIHISVWGEDTLNQEIRVLPDGSISFPLVGTLRVAGLSTPEVAEVITKSLQEYIPDPDVSVIVTATDGNRIFVLGKVGQPGPIVMTAPLTVMEALSLSGGLGTFADENDIRILRQSAAGEEQLEVRYNDIMSGKDLSSNHQLKAGDTILVP